MDKSMTSPIALLYFEQKNCVPKRSTVWPVSWENGFDERVQTHKWEVNVNFFMLELLTCSSNL